MVFVILYAGIGLGPDEAQYWTWSQNLDWGYYSKPPGIAWQIGVGTSLFGNTELGVRILSVLLAILQCIAIYFLALACKLRPMTAFWAAMAFALSPLGFLASLFAITDVGFVLFWTLACLVVAYALSDKHAPNYYLLGLVIAAGALFKWPIYLFWIFVLAFIPFFPFLFDRNLFGGSVVSLLGLLPSVIWNASHQWVTFRHVFATVIGRRGDVSQGAAVLPQGNFLEFLGAQVALLSPILFGLFLLSLVFLVKHRKNVSPALLFCGVVTCTLLLIYSGMALMQKVQGNWAVFAYPTAVVCLSWCACEVLSKGKIWLIAGVVLSVILSLGMLVIPKVGSIPYKLNPFRQNMGWDRLKEVLTEAGYDPERDFLFGDKYQMSSLLSFYGPGQNRAYFLNLHGARKNQFSFWPGMQEKVGKDGFFVLAENKPQTEMEKAIEGYREMLGRYCKEVHFMGVKPLYVSGEHVVKSALIFKCVGYNGIKPVDVEVY